MKAVRLMAASLVDDLLDAMFGREARADTLVQCDKLCATECVIDALGSLPLRSSFVSRMQEIVGGTIFAAPDLYALLREQVKAGNAEVLILVEGDDTRRLLAASVVERVKRARGGVVDAMDRGVEDSEAYLLAYSLWSCTRLHGCKISIRMIRAVYGTIPESYLLRLRDAGRKLVKRVLEGIVSDHHMVAHAAINRGCVPTLADRVDVDSWVDNRRKEVSRAITLTNHTPAMVIFTSHHIEIVFNTHPAWINDSLRSQCADV